MLFILKIQVLKFEKQEFKFILVKNPNQNVCLLVIFLEYLYGKRFMK